MDFRKYLEQNKDAALLSDKVYKAKKTWKNFFTDFITPDYQEFLRHLCKTEDIYVSFFGGKGDFERAVGFIGNMPFEGKYPVDIIKIKANSRFENLNHRDYLGAIFSLGIKREKVGDINVYEDGAEIYIHSDISDYVYYSITKIKHVGVSVDKIDIEEAREKKQNFRDMNINISALRLDALVASLTKESRNQSQSLIKSGNIKINYVISDDSSARINVGDLLSIKGYGRFVISDILNITRSDRLNILVKKYI